MKYSPLDGRDDRSDQDSQSAEDSEKLLPSDSLPHIERRSGNSRRWKIINIALIPLTGLLSMAIGIWIGSSYLSNADKLCTTHFQNYSPILKDVDTSIHTVLFNGSFMKENAFRKKAGPEVDAAWESLGVNYRPLSVSLSEGLKSGFSPSHVKINPKYGSGHPANVEGLHHLHCLNLVRQSLYYNIDYYRAQGKGAFVNKEYIVQYHVSHCLDIIRQQLMCMPDTGLLGQVWWDTSSPKPFVDFNTRHKCKDFEGIRKWAEERQLPAKVAHDFLQPPKIGDVIFDEIP